VTYWESNFKHGTDILSSIEPSYWPERAPMEAVASNPSIENRNWSPAFFLFLPFFCAFLSLALIDRYNLPPYEGSDGVASPDDRDEAAEDLLASTNGKSASIPCRCHYDAVDWAPEATLETLSHWYRSPTTKARLLFIAIPLFLFPLFLLFLFSFLPPREKEPCLATWRTYKTNASKFREKTRCWLRMGKAQTMK